VSSLASISATSAAAGSADGLGATIEQVDELARLVNQLLLLEKLESNSGGELRPERFDLLELARSLVDYLRVLAEERGVRIEVSGDAAPVDADRAQIRQVLVNLIDNALKYATPGTPVRIVVRPADAGSAGARRLGRPGVKISVIDQGEGIAREHLSRLTERFYRVDRARSRALMR